MFYIPVTLSTMQALTVFYRCSIYFSSRPRRKRRKKKNKKRRLGELLFSPFQSIKENTFDSTGLELWKASPSRLSFLLSIWRKEELRTKVKLIASISRLVCEEKKGEDTLKTNDGLQRISQRHPASTYEKFRKLMGENRHEGALHSRPC